MKHQLYIYITIFLVMFFAILSVQNPEYTGAAAADDSQTYAYTLDHIINNNLGTYEVRFPTGACADTLEQLYQMTAGKPLEVTAGYSTKGNDKVASLTFGMDRSLGSLDIVKGGITGLSEETLVSIETHTTVRMPPGVVRLTSLNMNLYGYTRGEFFVTRGTFSTPSLNCEFTSQEGKAICDCRAHPPQSTLDKSWTEA